MHAQQDLLLLGELVAEFFGTLRQILRLLQGFKIKTPHVGVDRLRIIIAQVTETGFDFLFLDVAVQLAESREDFDQDRQHGVGGSGRSRRNGRFAV